MSDILQPRPGEIILRTKAEAEAYIASLQAQEKEKQRLQKERDRQIRQAERDRLKVKKKQDQERVQFERERIKAKEEIAKANAETKKIEAQNELALAQAQKEIEIAKVKTTPKNIATTEEIVEAVQNAYGWWMAAKMNPPITDEDCENRVRQYFEKSIEKRLPVTAETFALAMGTDRKTLEDWKNGAMGQKRARIILDGMEMLAAVDADLTIRGKMPVVGYIFRSKNYYGLNDEGKPQKEEQKKETSREDLLKAASMLPI